MRLKPAHKLAECIIALIMIAAFFTMPVIESMPFYDSKGKEYHVVFKALTYYIVEGYVILHGLTIFHNTFKMILATELGKAIVSIITLRFSRIQPAPEPKPSKDDAKS